MQTNYDNYVEAAAKAQHKQTSKQSVYSKHKTVKAIRQSFKELLQKELEKDDDN